MLFAARSIARATAGPSFRMNGVRANSTLPIPPKIATPKSAQGPGGASARMESVVGFYKSLPKGDAPQKRGGGIKARYFDGKNASGKPIVATLFTLFLIGYSIDYATHLRHHKNNHH
ncbi:related to ATP17 - ATP synthase complex, subunit f [Melanopsichium pennsylvanicum]|uniref:Related to ATP17 - ATP synthase complex, subunit f n=2 Tax=Melanopsichium pennsylvanicum TaxID=63383 RepID=A0AAJ4XM68_9BASI|nr:related to ATP17 - ATP synthase complex, subunit f [Melanopsichium pennsylvanicum]